MYAQPFILPTIPPTSNVGPMPGPVTGQATGPMPNLMPGPMPTSVPVPVPGPVPGQMTAPMPMTGGPPPVGAISVAPIPPPLPSVKKKSEPQKEKTEKAIKMMRSAQESYNTPDIGPNGMPLPNPMQIPSNMPQAMILKPGWGGGH